MTRRRLELPSVCRAIPHTTRNGIERGEIDVPSDFIGLPTIEDGRFDDPRPVVERSRDHAVSDVGRIERVVRQRGKRIFRGRRAVGERDGTESRLARRRACNRQARLARDRCAPNRGELHDQIVRVLPVDQRPSVQRHGFAHLKDLAVSKLARRHQIETEHPVEREPRRPDASGQHAHPPIRHCELIDAARTALMVEQAERDAVLHELPTRWLRRRLTALCILVIRRLSLCRCISGHSGPFGDPLGDRWRRDAYE